MRIIREDVVTPATLTSNVPITETEWTPGTYTLGQQRYVGTDLYEVTAASTTDDPIAGEAKEPKTWVRIGKINRWKMFSELVAEQTVHPSPLTLEIVTAPTTNAIAVFGVDAGSVEVVTYSEGVETGRASKPMTNVYEVTNLFEYFFQPITRIEEGVILDLPSYGTDRIVITLTSDGTPVSIGKLVIGEAVTIGQTALDVVAELEDFSERVRDPFGGFGTVVERLYARNASYTVFIPAAKVPAVHRQLAAVRAKPTVYIGDPNSPETIVMGFYKAVSTVRLSRDLSKMTMDVEGVV